MISRQLTILAVLAASTSCVVRGNVPDLEQDTVCVPGYEERVPSFCDWVKSTDAIAVGKLVGIRWDRAAPVSLTTGADASANCEYIDGLLEMQLELMTVLHGPLRAGEQVTIIGQGTDQWRPKPISTDPDRGVVQWMPSETPGLVVGQLLGVALHRQPNGEKWGTYKEPFFIEEDGRLRFSKMLGQCELAAPVSSGDFASSSELERAVDSCPAATPASQDRRAAIDQHDEWRPVCLDRTSVESDVDLAD